CICGNLRKASRAITKLYDEFLQPSGLLVTQFNLISALNTQSPAALTPLAERIGMDPTTLARNLKPLERDGLVEIVEGEDRRVRMVKLTERGKEAYANAVPLWQQAQTYVISQIGEERWRIMIGDWTELTTVAHT